MTILRWLMGGLAVVAIGTTLWARPGTVKMRDGASYEGDITEAEDGSVVVKVRNVDMRIDRRNVAGITYIDDAAGDFKKKLAALGPKDIKGRLELAQSALSQRQYDWAKQAAQGALDIDPNSKEATDFLMMIRRQQELERTPKADQKPQPGGDPLMPDASGNPKGTPAAVDRKTLTADDINLIRQFELGSEENNFRATLLNDVRKRFVAQDAQGTLAEFTALPVQKQARYILSRAPGMRNDVRINSDPASITQYRQRVQPAILAGCATTACHGGGNAGNFVLINPADNEAVAYTNFYILTQFVKKLDKDAMAQMIHRTAPDKSLLLQYSLPPDAADLHHPASAGFRPPFRNTADPRYKIISDWLSNSLNPTAPDYGIKFTPPTASSPDTPSTKPANK